ncbi:MAG: hypothetical protein H7Z72_01465 [Bacteroidetes bacterium]|nr:hypothetical protein [Fibrella sp.]
MQTFVVEILNEKAVPLLRDLEDLNIIRLIPQEPEPDKQPDPDQDERPLSEQLWGCISPEVATDLHRQLAEMRDEWK